MSHPPSTTAPLHLPAVEFVGAAAQGLALLPPRVLAAVRARLDVLALTLRPGQHGAATFDVESHGVVCAYAREPGTGALQVSSLRAVLRPAPAPARSGTPAADPLPLSHAGPSIP